MRAATQERFDQYFASRRVGYAFEVLCAVHYPRPLSETQIRSLVPGFQVPQNFLYVEPLPSLGQVLESAAFSAVLSSSRRRVRLQPLQPQNAPKFVKLVGTHVGTHYRQTGTS